MAGAHVKSSVDLYSMETACATGRDAAFEIINIYNKNKQTALKVNKPLLMNIFGKFDNILYMCGLPNIVDVIILCVIFYVISKLL